MGLNSVTNLAIKYGDDFLNACAKTRGMVSKTFQKPASIYPEVIDQSISPMFLQSLKNIEGDDTVGVIRKIKDLIMKAMGFKHPELLEACYDDYSKAVCSSGGFPACFEPIKGGILLGDQLMAISKEEVIGALRHEIDHVEKVAKLYKSVGAEEFTRATVKRAMNNQTVSVPLQYQYRHDFFRPNIDVLEKLSKDVDITDFDTKKYLDAWIGSSKKGLGPMGIQYEYFNNALEKSAYKVQGFVHKNLGINIATAAEIQPKNYLKIMSLLEKQGVKDPIKRDVVLDTLAKTISWKKEPDAKELLTFMKKACLSEEITSEDIAYITNRQWKLTEKETDCIYKEVEDRIVAGKFTLEDILAEIDDVLAK